jgi:hypothetical protein
MLNTIVSTRRTVVESVRKRQNARHPNLVLVGAGTVTDREWTNTFGARCGVTLPGTRSGTSTALESNSIDNNATFSVLVPGTGNLSTKTHTALNHGQHNIYR